MNLFSYVDTIIVPDILFLLTGEIMSGFVLSQRINPGEKVLQFCSFAVLQLLSYISGINSLSFICKITSN
jgi:hypothetical protein